MTYNELFERLNQIILSSSKRPSSNPTMNSEVQVEVDGKLLTVKSARFKDQTLILTTK